MEADTIVEKRSCLPEINLEDGVLNIMGRSTSEKSGLFIEPIIIQFYQYAVNPFENTQINIKLDYINSESTRSLMTLIIIAEKIFKKGKNVNVNWYVKPDDDLMIEQGYLISSLVLIPFNMINY